MEMRVRMWWHFEEGFQAEDVERACTIDEDWKDAWTERVYCYQPCSQRILEFATDSLAEAIQVFRIVYKSFRQLGILRKDPVMYVEVLRRNPDGYVHIPNEELLFQEILRLHVLVWNTVRQLKATRTWIRDDRIEAILHMIKEPLRTSPVRKQV